MSLERRDPFARRLLVTVFSREAISRPRARKSSDFRISLMSGTPQCHFFAPPWTKFAEIGTFSTAFGYFRPVSGVALLSADASTCGFSKSLFSKQRFSASIVCRNTDFRNFCPQDARKVASGLSDGSEMANEAATPPHRPVAHRPITQRPIAPSPRRPITQRPITLLPIAPSFRRPLRPALARPPSHPALARLPLHPVPAPAPTSMLAGNRVAALPVPVAALRRFQVLWSHAFRWHKNPHPAERSCRHV